MGKGKTKFQAGMQSKKTRIIIPLLLFVVFFCFSISDISMFHSYDGEEISYTQLMNYVSMGSIKSVYINNDKVEVYEKNSTRKADYYSIIPNGGEEALIEAMNEHEVVINSTQKSEPTIGYYIIASLCILSLIILTCMFVTKVFGKRVSSKIDTTVDNLSASILLKSEERIRTNVLDGNKEVALIDSSTSDSSVIKDEDTNVVEKEEATEEKDENNQTSNSKEPSMENTEAPQEPKQETSRTSVDNSTSKEEKAPNTSIKNNCSPKKKPKEKKQKTGLNFNLINKEQESNQSKPKQSPSRSEKGKGLKNMSKKLKSQTNIAAANLMQSLENGSINEKNHKTEPSKSQSKKDDEKKEQKKDKKQEQKANQTSKEVVAIENDNIEEEPTLSEDIF